MGYEFKAKGVSLFEAGVNVNWLFNLGSKIKIYPIVGLGYANIKGYISVDDSEYEGAMNNYNNYNGGSYLDDMDISDSASKFYYNIGIGGEYAISEHISACLEVKYQGISHFNRLPISLGVVYKF